DRVVKSPIGRQLTAALDDWAYIRRALNSKGWQRRLALARAADPDRWRNRLRDALERKDDRALGEVIQSASAGDWRPATLVLLGRIARGTGLAEPAAALLRQAQQQHPSDFWINHGLGTLFYGMQPPRLEDALHYSAIAVALRPQSPWAHSNFGVALYKKGRLDEAIAEYKEAIRLKKDDALAHNNLGAALYDQGRLDEATAEFQEAIRLNKDIAEAHYNLGNALRAKDQLDEAIA